MRLSFGEAVELSLRQAPDIASARAGVTAADVRASGTGAQRFPKLRAEANVLRWDTPLVINFTPSDSVVARSQITTQVSISLAQPISGLFVLGHLLAIDESGAQAARAEVSRARLDSAARAAETYVRVLQARAIEHVAVKSVAQLEAQLAQGRTLEQGGVLGKVDVLRLISARDSAQQSLVRAQTGVAVAAGSLAVALDLSPETVIEVVDDLPDPPPPIIVTESDAMRTATSKRPELQSAAERTRQSHEGKVVAMAELLPNVMGVGTFQNVQGQGPFQPKNAWYIGATLTWDIWDWGKTWNKVKESRARATQADISEKVLRDQIALEARRRLLEARAAFATLAPARTSLEAAEEANRIQGVRFSAGTASTTDVINGETDLSRARSAYAQARYDYYLAQAALVRAVGDLPATPRPPAKP
jgi:outer membrane protein